MKFHQQRLIKKLSVYVACKAVQMCNPCEPHPEYLVQYHPRHQWETRQRCCTKVTTGTHEGDKSGKCCTHKAVKSAQQSGMSFDE